MGVTYSFFNSIIIDGIPDRPFNATHIRSYFAALIGNGVRANPSTTLQVLHDSGMSIRIAPGIGFIDGAKLENDSDLLITLDTADGVLKRIDRIVLRLDESRRLMELVVKKGTLASSPVAPTLQRDANVYELALADVFIDNGATAITQANITDQRLQKQLCGVVTGLFDQADLTTIALQYQAAFAQMTAEQRQDFQNWFNDLQVTLDGNVAASLTNRMIGVEGRASVLETDVTELIDQVVTTPTPNKLLKLDGTGMLNFLALPTLSKNIYVRKSDGNGVGIFSLVYDTPVNIILLAYRKSDATQFVFATGYRTSWASGTGLNVVASNGLALGAYNSSGTQVINGAPASDIFVTAIILGGGQA